jgi:hypothetical protein
MLLQRQTEERPSLPTGFGKPWPLASLVTLCGDSRSRLAISTAITSSVRESICKEVSLIRLLIQINRASTCASHLRTTSKLSEEAGLHLSAKPCGQFGVPQELPE